MLARIGRSVVSLLVLCALLALAPGCGGERTARVTGKVTFQGKELDGGYVVFVNDKATWQERAKIGSDGTYSAAVVYGVIKYAVEPAPKPLSANIPKGMLDKGKKIPADKDAAGAAKMYSAASEGTYVDIPVAYRAPESSKWVVTIDGSKTLDIDIPSK